MAGRDFDTDVLIVGAGPAGLVLACDLARRGVAFRLIDQRAGPMIASRGKGLQPRTLEVFEDLGVLPQILRLSGPYPLMRFFKGDTVLAGRDGAQTVRARYLVGADTLGGGSRLFEAFMGPRFTLLLFGEAPKPVGLEGLPVRTLRLPSDAALAAATYGISGDGAVLVRRDGYIALIDRAPTTTVAANWLAEHVGLRAAA